MLISNTPRLFYNEKEQARQKELQNMQFEKKNIIMESNVGAKACAESSKERPDAKWKKGVCPQANLIQLSLQCMKVKGPRNVFVRSNE